jgi:hypothetical protein
MSEAERSGTSRHRLEGTGAHGTQCLPVAESRPVFADPSGRRRRVLRYAGRAAVACLAACLGAVVVAMTGGPQAPFTQWAVQPGPAISATDHASAQPAGRAAGRASGGSSGRAASGPAQNVQAAAPGASAPATASPSPSQGASPSAQPSASATASSSAVPVNPAGKTPPGHTKSANPRSSASVA